MEGLVSLQDSPAWRALLAYSQTRVLWLRGWLVAAEQSSITDIDSDSTGGLGNNGVDKQYQA